MTTTSAATAVRECGTARIRAHSRHLATVLTVRGQIGPANAADMADHIRRYLMSRTPIVVDISAVHPVTTQTLTLITELDADCTVLDLDWVLVADDDVIDPLTAVAGRAMPVTARSVAAAIHHLADSVAWRRNALLPLLENTA